MVIRPSSAVCLGAEWTDASFAVHQMLDVATDQPTFDALKALYR